MQMQPNERVSIELLEGGIAHVRLTRGDKLNALDAEMFARIVEAGRDLHTRKGVRVVVVSGDGRGFCAGLDMAAMAGGPLPGEADLTERTHGDSNIFQQVAMQWRKLPVPVIAAIHGVCFGGGLQIASGADIRIVAPDARLSIMELKWGIVPDMGGFALWRGMVRDDVLRELVYTNREFTGEEAAVLGLATIVDADPLARAMALAAEISARNPHAIRAAKRLANGMHDRATETILQEESFEQHALMRSKNQMEAVMAAMQKRAPDFDEA